MAKNFFDSPWSWIAGLLTGIPFPAFRDAVTDKTYGSNSVDREYVASLKRQVENGELTEDEARAKLGEKYKGYAGTTSDEFYDSVDSSTGKGIEIGTGTGSAGALGGIAGILQSLVAYYTRNELTGAEREQNAFNADQAQMSRDFTEYMARNKYTMETQSMQDAGVNPAMVYGGGNLVPTASNGASAQGSPIGAGSIVDLISTMVRMPRELKMLDAEIDRTKAEADLTRQRKATEEFETRIRGINAEYQEALNGQTLQNMQADYDNTVADTNYKTAQRDYVKTQRDAQAITNKYLDSRQQAELANIKASTDKMSAEEKKTKAEKVYQDWYNNFVQANGFLPSSNDTLMIMTYVASLFGIAKDNVQEFIKNAMDSIGDYLSGTTPRDKGKGGDTSPTGGNITDASQGNSR